ncbi:SUN domain-containing protein 1 isoform X2 [Conger conger]|uniref:SUN domain-containing protein 1 isoform X2 n=1 Tax=Conger conger TaxID=82655 RepID=UPI002A5998B4|nr:SUN domain-containing protein 1 isoform X2 [Conger conger]
MTMDYSHLHTYTPPQCAPENTGYTYSLSSSYSSAALDFEKEHKIDPVFDSPRMSRRSLRLGHHGDDSLQLDSSLTHSAPCSAGGASRREARTVRSRKQQSGTQTRSQTQTQTQTQSSSQCSSSSVLVSQSGCAAGHALLGESRLLERTVADGYWGLDGDKGLKEGRTQRSTVQGNGDVSMTQTQTQTQASMANGYICRDCSIHGERKGALTACSSTSAAASSSSASSSSSLSQSASIYSHDSSQKHKSGALVRLSRTCVRYGGHALTWAASLVGLLIPSVVLRRGDEASGQQGAGVLASVAGTCLCYSRGVFTSVVSLMSLLLLKTTGFRAKGHQEAIISEGGHSSYCGSVNVKDLVTGDQHLNLNGSLCDDCKGKQHMEMRAVSARSSWARRLGALLWSVCAYTGYGVLQTGRSVGAAGLYVIRKLLSVLWLLLISPGRAASAVFWWLGTGWYQLVTLMSLLNVFILTRCLPKLFRLLLFLLPFLLILALWFWAPASLLCYLPAVNLTQWRSAHPFTFSLTPSPTPSSPLEQAVRKAEDHPATAPPPVVPQAVFSLDAERLYRLEQRLGELWEGVQKGGRLQEQQHGEVLGLYSSLQEQLDRRTDRDSLGLWVSGLLEHRLTLLRSEIQQETTQTEKTQEELRLQQQGYAARLSELEALLQVLAAKTQEVQQKQDTPPPAPVSVGVDRESHDALLLEVQRLEAELGIIRQDLQGVLGCRGKCEQLDGLRDTVSAQVRRELQALFYGGEEGELPEPLLGWLSAQFARGSDLQASLVSLETSILRNVSLQLEQSKQPPCPAAVTATVELAAKDAGMSEEQVQLIVQNALRLYSQDRTGQVDYALESGGGSILSTRCSETYETKTALMSLFGLPLWYFSQSPRVVIQPDMYPGNCWAFKGSHGYLVIRLSLSVVPTAFCLEHISKTLSPTGTISSAPRHFIVYGLDDEYQEEGKLLGRYTYQEDGESLQTFPVTEENDEAYQIIEVRVLSNWGHPEYTCLYRFRVHGERKSK